MENIHYENKYGLELVKEYDMYDIVRVHQSVVYGPHGTIQTAARLAKQQRPAGGRGGDDDSSSADEDDYRRMEEPHLRNDWFDHYAYERELNAPILSKIRAPAIFSYDKKKTIAGTGPDGANGDGQGPDSDLITKRFIHDTYRKMEVSKLNQ